MTKSFFMNKILDKIVWYLHFYSRFDTKIKISGNKLSNDLAPYSPVQRRSMLSTPVASLELCAERNTRHTFAQYFGWTRID